jgi:tripartite-type tricarboxylate transporter receptor subunit TctC
MLRLTAFLVALALPWSPALSQEYPNRAVKLVVPFAAGGPADIYARFIAQRLQDALGQSFVVENKPGGGSVIGTDQAAKSPADGYTLLMSSGGTISINPSLYAKMPFDPAKDLQPVAAAARVLVFLVMRPDLPPKDIKSFIDYARANPGKLSFGSPGNGSSPHLAGEMFKSAAKLFAIHIPYRGAAPALTDLLGNQLDFMFDPGIGLTHVRSGKLRLLAVGSPKRSPLFPDVPTLDEAGLKGFDADSMFGFYAPAGVPQDIVARLNREINRQLQTPAIRDRVAALGGEVAPMTPAEFAERGRRDAERFGAIIRERKIVGD